MDPQSPRLAAARWVRWGAVAALLLAAYAALGFLVAPYAIERQLPRFVASELGRQASLRAVRINPFTLRLEAEDLKLAEADGQPLFAVGRLLVQLEWRSILRRAWSFAEVRVTTPQASLAIASDGRFNVAELIATITRRWPPDPASEGKLPPLRIGQFAIDQGRVEFHDRRAGYDNVLAPIAFTLQDFSTAPGGTESLQFSARSARGGKMVWKGQLSLAPIRGSGELALDDVSLPELAVYLSPYTRARVAAGQLSTRLPYRFSYASGQWDASLAGAQLALQDVALAREGASETFAALTRLELRDVDAGWAAREVKVGEVRATGGKLAVLRDAKGQLDLANLLVATAGPAAAAPAADVVVDRWKLQLRQLLLDQVALTLVDESVQPALRLAAGQVRLQLKATAQAGGPQLQMQVEEASGAATDLSLSRGNATPAKLAEVGFEGGRIDLAARRAELARLYARGGTLQVRRDRQGRIDLAAMLPPAGAATPGEAADASTAPWSAQVGRVELDGFGADFQDEASGLQVRVREAAAKALDVRSDLRHPVKFEARLRVNEAGQIAAQGRVVPATAALQADLRVARLPLAPLQPLLRQFVKLRVTQGSVSGQGRLASGDGKGGAKLRYVGALHVAGLVLLEEDGNVFASWKDVGAERLTASLGPDLVDIPELRVDELNAKLIIEDDRSFNAARLLVQPAARPAAAVPTAAAAPVATGEGFPVRVRRLRVQGAKLDFADLSLRPQFAARIHELNGVLTGLSTQPGARTQIELDGRVDEFGTVRARGDLNLLAPAENTDVNVVFRNVDMVPASPYSAKFAGYQVAEGKISLDLQYKLRDHRLQGENQIVIDRLTLGERVDSPDALKLPLQLAIAILKDKDGRIELGLPVTGDLSDPQFSYGAIIWKALGTLLTKIVTAPFRALGSLLGLDADKMEAIQFDPGSDRLLPPEREKLRHVADMLAKRPQLVLSVPAQYGETADAAALRVQAVRLEVARRAGITLAPGEAPGPVDFGDGAVRKAVRELYVARFGEAGLDQQKRAAENATPAAAASGTKPKSAKDQVPLWQRVGKVLQGEPQVADAAGFYQALLQRLNETQPLPAEAMTTLASRRAQSVLQALQEAGVEAGRLRAGAPQKLESETKGTVPLKLALDVR